MFNPRRTTRKYALGTSRKFVSHKKRSTCSFSYRNRRFSRGKYPGLIFAPKSCFMLWFFFLGERLGIWNNCILNPDCPRCFMLFYKFLKPSRLFVSPSLYSFITDSILISLNCIINCHQLGKQKFILSQFWWIKIFAQVLVGGSCSLERFCRRICSISFSLLLVLPAVHELPWPINTSLQYFASEVVT